MMLNPRTKYFLYLPHREQTSTWVYCSIKALLLTLTVQPQHTASCSSVAVAEATPNMMTKMAKESWEKKYGCVDIVLPSSPAA